MYSNCKPLKQSDAHAIKVKFLYFREAMYLCTINDYGAFCAFFATTAKYFFGFKLRQTKIVSILWQ